MSYSERYRNASSCFVTSKLDNCNSLLAGLPQYLLDKVQRVQNAAARLVSCTRKYDRISPVLKELHWLPVKQRIVFKILLLTYKALNALAPRYISDFLININHLERCVLLTRNCYKFLISS